MSAADSAPDFRSVTPSGGQPTGCVASLIVIGYGNTLRNDDAVGPRVVEAIEARHFPGVSTLSCPLLTPEIAEPVSRASMAIFVDAAVDAPRSVQLRKLAPADSSQVTAHAAGPRTILALARDVFGHSPEAWLLTLPVVDLGLGDRLSPLAQRGTAFAIQWLAEFLSDLPSRREVLCSSAKAVFELA
jgi:hydrogenase maturation protease